MSSFLESQNQVSTRDQLLLQEYEQVKALNKDLLNVMGKYTFIHRLPQTHKEDQKNPERQSVSPRIHVQK